MKILSFEMIDVIEATASLKGSWIILENKYGKQKLTERVSFYEKDGSLFSIIDRSGSSKIYQYKDREEGNLHFNQMKLMVTALNGYFIHDKRSG